MGYFVHNKYDMQSITALNALGDNYGGHTLIDYYGDYEQYKMLNTSSGFGKVYTSLNYISPPTLLYNSQSPNTDCYFHYTSSLVLRSIQRGTFTIPKTNTSIEIALNFSISPDKCFVIINGMEQSTSQAYCSSLTSQTLTINKSSNIASAKGSWQVIEFK